MLEEASGTIFSFRDCVPPHIEDGDDEPDCGRLRPSSFLQGDSRIACALQRITAGGALLRTASAVQPGDRLNLELTSGLSVDATVAWQSGSRVGVSFDSELDVVGSIARDLVNQPDERRRVPRIELRCTACVQTRRATEFATTRDISQGGIKIETGLPLEPGEGVEISLDGLPPLAGEVRWRKDRLAGIEFTSELGWQTLMPWIRSMSRIAERLAGGGTFAPGDAPPLGIPARIREGTRRWNVVVAAIDENHVECVASAPIALDTLVWLILPELEGWAARVVRTEQDRFAASFAHPLRRDTLDRILASARARR